MKIGVVSDTHSNKVPQQVYDDLKKVDLIIHAGDFCSIKELKAFKNINKVRAVHGNMDGLELRQLLPERDIFEIEGVRFGLCHGHGSAGQILEVVKREFKKDKLDVVVFGHSHLPFNETIDGVLYFNPGSPNDIVRPPYCSYGILEIKNGEVTGEIIKVDYQHG